MRNAIRKSYLAANHYQNLNGRLLWQPTLPLRYPQQWMLCGADFPIMTNLENQVLCRIQALFLV